jgi:hypothetical protein
MCHSNDFGKDVEDVALVGGAAVGADELGLFGAAGDAAAAATGGGAVAADAGASALGGTAAATASDFGVPAVTAIPDAAAPVISGAADAGAGALGTAGAIDSSLTATASDFGVPDVSGIPDASPATIAPSAASPVAPSSLSNLMGSPTSTDAPGFGSNAATGNDSIDNALKQLGAGGKGVMQYAPLAGLGLSAYENHKAQSASQSLNNVAAPTLNTSNQLLQQFQSGQLNASDSYAINTFEQQQTAKINQYYASAGLSNSSMEADAIGQVQAQGEAMRSQALQTMLSNGLQAAGVAQGPQLAAVQASVAADNAMSAASANFMQALAKMNTTNNANNNNANNGG